jgi:hypothetical protein
MSIVGGQLPENDFHKKSVSECALHVHGESGVCMPKSAIDRIRAFLAEKNVPLAKSADERDIIRAAKATLGVEKESEVLEHPEIQSKIGRASAKRILDLFFKSIGPADSTALLDNFNIDETLNRWAVHSQELFGKKFYHIPFQMIDFQKMGTELSKLDIGSLMKSGYKCFAVVLNTDTHTGRGKHWFCIYGDLDHAGTEKDPIAIEYFNSSGNSPMSEVSDWLTETEHELRKEGIEANIIKSASRRLQESQTECGVWSLMYILSRLKGRPSNWFYKTRANDEDMIDVRKFLFRKK